jgi:hypothetical protein
MISDTPGIFERVRQQTKISSKEACIESCSIGNPQYAPEVWHKTHGGGHAHAHTLALSTGEINC